MRIYDCGAAREWKSQMAGSGEASRSFGERLFKIFWFIALICVVAIWGAGWALAIYAFIILVILALVKFYPRGGDKGSASVVERRSTLKALAVTLAFLIVASIGSFLLFPLR
ncbi:hypothetical protein QO058_18890 [Bosea vestrisii]|uniref:hypothetical protein n=1 Tax=Bosea vestrisii TaxID=151416 RepID=UPI0024DFD2D7|nr:hypothetical protein [Bosea vestrisii]WID94875.1 hypothetical protein QO058_18890 [Bosea vestrisii]